jgi:cellobiose phosphorylase
MAARIEVLSGIRVPSRRLVFEPFLPPLYDDYDIHPDTRTLALVRPVRASQEGEVTVVLNWLAALGPLTRQ